ncbi:M48 family metalloprotease [Roseinatronobacter alkalisoli]|uniref:M48 family metalloprotease n=1 Tax=Roseinatronobacter alkalisoli TaxID=3028235 RepID=A0ABT5TBL0_9RHOB|nr:M48 family metalloprotease [Roseinatronobacter sp. HJB301]MDD7972523.1 M48 family metalloprotease [Roseinatronobacter sp. HJB301]
MQIPHLLRKGAALGAFLLLSACQMAPVVLAPPPPAATTAPGPAVTRSQFGAVVARMRPVATQVCRERSPHLDCNFNVVLDDRPGQPPNAFHTRDAQGRPIIAFTEALLRELRSADEVALIFGHEAAHHIADHLPRMQNQAMTGALLGGLVATLSGADQPTAQRIVNASATVGARRYSKPFELEADRLGALIAARGGYDPLAAAALFRRIPDPGNQFLGTHPPNAERLREIERAVADMAAGRSF